MCIRRWTSEKMWKYNDVETCLGNAPFILHTSHIFNALAVVIYLSISVYSNKSPVILLLNDYTLKYIIPSWYTQRYETEKQAINLPSLHDKSHRNNSSNKELCVWVCVCGCGCRSVRLRRRSKTSFPSCASLEIIEWTHSPNDPLQPHWRLVNSRSSMYDFTSHWDLFCVGILPFDINISMLSFNFS